MCVFAFVLLLVNSWSCLSFCGNKTFLSMHLVLFLFEVLSFAFNAICYAFFACRAFCKLKGGIRKKEKRREERKKKKEGIK